ncbi:MAG: hypothetical protein QNK51_01025 [Chitinophagales bacterium]
MNKKCIILVLLLISSQFLLAQTEKQFLKAGDAAYKDGKHYEAIAYLKNALKFNKNNEQAINQIALSYYALQDYPNAEVFFEQTTRSASYPLIDFYKANNYKLLGEYSKARSTFQSFNNAYEANDFFKIKSQHEVSSCAWAQDQLLDNGVEIKQFEKPLNTGFSDFAAGYIDSNRIQVTTLKSNKKNLKDEFQAKLFFYDIEGLESKEMEDLYFPSEMTDTLDIANGFYLKEKQTFYYSQCASANEGKKLCDIYAIGFDGDTWSSARRLEINTNEFTETQATASINEQGVTVLYFISDRAGGEGKLDIWASVADGEGRFKEANNLGPSINTIDNESTPFYDEDKHVLYFSSEWYYGFGGYDIFKTKLGKDGYITIENLGLPINSSANDQYYYPTPYNHALFASNREGAMQLRNSACCFDVFAHTWEEELPDTILLASIDTVDPLMPFIASLQEQLPATVYFHNDEPNPKTTATTTNLAYNDCYDTYLAVQGDYFDAFGDNQAIGAWFNEVELSYEELQSFLETLTLVLADRKVDLSIEGYCSPLALNGYNINLAKRRIISLENHLLQWNDGVLKEYYDAGNLTFTPVPVGEEKADPNISDSVNETKYSIYDPKAAQERRAAIIAVEVY